MARLALVGDTSGMETTTHVTGTRVAQTMRAHGVTIRELAAAMQITMKRVREARREGVSGNNRLDWSDGIARARDAKAAATA